MENRTFAINWSFSRNNDFAQISVKIDNPKKNSKPVFDHKNFPFLKKVCT